MKPQETTIANAELWSQYFRQEWRRALDPFGLAADSPVGQIADGTAARVANFLTLVAAGPIAWLYASKSPEGAAEDGEREYETSAA